MIGQQLWEGSTWRENEAMRISVEPSEQCHAVFAKPPINKFGHRPSDDDKQDHKSFGKRNEEGCDSQKES